MEDRIFSQIQYGMVILFVVRFTSLAPDERFGMIKKVLGCTENRWWQTCWRDGTVVKTGKDVGFEGLVVRIHKSD